MSFYNSYNYFFCEKYTLEIVFKINNQFCNFVTVLAMILLSLFSQLLELTQYFYALTILEFLNELHSLIGRHLQLIF